MAGCVPRCCRYGMQCNKPDCQFSHPNKVSSFHRHSIEQVTCAARGVIVVSVVSAWGEFCIAYTSLLVKIMRSEVYSWIFVRVELG